ncbi:unnamed protein product [Caenorhabditis auriculariae]|uniref:Uncharacterized protein n=1 Tax=Caenorhabditis auriculariae TaxID=2777116 RepID=A0A8S1H7K6_9PELO|nr:unnamed protein product [Caenorhabditis auriculariae]
MTSHVRSSETAKRITRNVEEYPGRVRRRHAYILRYESALHSISARCFAHYSRPAFTVEPSTPEMPASLDFKWTSPRSVSGVSGSTALEVDQKVEIDMSNTYCDQVLGPLYSYMMLLGLNHTHSKARNSVWRIPMTIYNYFTIVILGAATIRRITQVKQNPKDSSGFQGSVLDPTFVLTLCHALLLFSGLSAAFLLLKLQKQRERMYFVLDQGLGRNRNEEHDKQHFVLNKFFVAFSFLFSAAMAAVQIATKMGFIGLPDTPHLINQKYYFILLEGYVIFLAQSSISLLAILFFQLCRILQFSIKRLIDEMIHYQEIYNAKYLIEDNFSFALFYTYGCCIPLTCLLGYISFRNAQADVTETFAVFIWLVNTMSTLMLFSVPAFMIHEEGDKLLSASFKMYHETLCEERDLLVLLFSAIFTYFLILVQFDTDGSQSLCNETSRVLIVQPP